jgi:hypothetical protein
MVNTGKGKLLFGEPDELSVPNSGIETNWRIRRETLPIPQAEVGA